MWWFSGVQRDVLLYAVGIGCHELRFAYERDPAFAVFPTFPVSLIFKGDESGVVPFPPPRSVRLSARDLRARRRAWNRGGRRDARHATRTRPPTHAHTEKTPLVRGVARAARAPPSRAP